jgi:polysaccharide biosynthesis/export protein
MYKNTRVRVIRPGEPQTTTMPLPVILLPASNRLRLVLLAVCLPAAGVLSTSCATSGRGDDAAAQAGLPNPEGRLAPGDEIQITFSGAPEQNAKRKIQPDGKVSLPILGDVQAAGRSVQQLQTSLASLYQSHLQDPGVSVSLESAASGIYVSGEVLRPGKVPLDRPMTALEAVMEAGGFTKFANPKQVIIIRKTASRQLRYVLNINDTLAGAETKPFHVRPFDVIYVRQSAW